MLVWENYIFIFVPSPLFLFLFPHTNFHFFFSFLVGLERFNSKINSVRPHHDEVTKAEGCHAFQSPIHTKNLIEANS